jgi:hypothetical protein
MNCDVYFWEEVVERLLYSTPDSGISRSISGRTSLLSVNLVIGTQGIDTLEVEGLVPVRLFIK